MTQIELKLTLEEVNLALEGLGNLPYARVFELVQKIQSQARGQLQNDALPQSQSVDLN